MNENAVKTLIWLEKLYKYKLDIGNYLQSPSLTAKESFLWASILEDVEDLEADFKEVLHYYEEETEMSSDE